MDKLFENINNRLKDYEQSDWNSITILSSREIIC
jgi:hypothetical protein